MTDTRRRSRVTVSRRSTIISPTEEDVLVCSDRDWHRVRRSIGGLRAPIPWTHTAGWASSGVAASAYLSFAAWNAAYPQLSPSSQADNVWIGPIMLVGALAATAFAVLCYALNRQASSALRIGAQHILEDMDDIHDPNHPEGAPSSSLTDETTPAHDVPSA